MKERELNMQVKVFYGDKVKTINTARNSTYEDLLDKALNVFEISDKKENCRLRSYNVPNQIMQDTYTGKEKIVLDELKIYPNKSLALEVKKDEEVFTEFDPNLIQIKINVWCPGIETLYEMTLNSVRIFVKRFGKLYELIDALEKAIGIPKEYLL